MTNDLVMTSSGYCLAGPRNVDISWGSCVFFVEPMLRKGSSPKSWGDDLAQAGRGRPLYVAYVARFKRWSYK